MKLHEKLKESVTEWRKNGYVCEDWPLIGEILRFQTDDAEHSACLKYLREPQFLALEVYWYIRIVQSTPHIIDLYRHYYGDDASHFLKALGVRIPRGTQDLANIDADNIIQRIKTDQNFVKQRRLQTLHEAVTLDYPSYILALAMGSGKTALIGTIIATEFSMSIRYGDDKFMRNALVFAPGTTIIESLREISSLPYEEILPPGLHKDFMANLKIEYVGSEQDIQTQPESNYNLIVSNTEKISLRARRTLNQSEIDFQEKELSANRRLQKITSLPRLGIFSDEAHHTYGNAFDQLKRVRETINYIHEKTPIVAMVNTTGTPYYRKQHLKEVIVWYGLGEGIRDNILKSLKNGIYQYDIAKQPEHEVFQDILAEFFSTYGDTALPNGAKAKIAFYFKTQEHLDNSLPMIENALMSLQEDTSQILVNTQRSNAAQSEEFKSLNSPANSKRVILLIARGVEGWNCPSLFSCALIKEQTTSNNYILQASTRCLRQISGYTHSAKIFLDSNNARILDEELHDNFGTDLDQLGANAEEKEQVTLKILKTEELPKLEINRTVERVIKNKTKTKKVTLSKPKPRRGNSISRHILTLTPDFQGRSEMLLPTGETVQLSNADSKIDCHTVAWAIASRYHTRCLPILQQLQDLYPRKEVPQTHLLQLFNQVENQLANYRIIRERVTEVMALIRVRDETGQDLFEKDEEGTYVHQLRLLESTYENMHKHKLFVNQQDQPDDHNLSFHYTPYNFDSAPERSLFRRVLDILNMDRSDVDVFLFTGGLTDPRKTDFHFEYKGQDGYYHKYFPDFVIVKKTGEFYIVEVKSENMRENAEVIAKEKAVRQLEKLQQDKFKYNVVYTSTSMIDAQTIKPISDWIRGNEKI